MTRPPLRPSLSALLVLAVLAATACDRGASPAADPAPPSTVLATPPGASSATPLPVSPSGQTNSSTASAGNDLSNSTRASGQSNAYQPSSTDNPPPGGPPSAAGASSPPAAASQGVSSRTRGTSPMPDDGTLPRGTEGSTGSRRGGGKS